MDVRLADGRTATYEVIGAGEPLLSFVGGPGMPARFMRPDARHIAAHVPGAELLIIPDCGHMPALEQPQTYRDAVLGWCAAHPA